MNQARSALSLVIPTSTQNTFGDTAIVKRFMAGVFKLKPTFPRYTTTFDASMVLQHLRLITNDLANLKDLSMKLSLSLSLLTGKRDQSLAELTLEYMVIEDTKITFFVPVIVKTTKPGKHIPPLELNKYPPDGELCPVALINKYLVATNVLRNGEQKLFLSYKKPHKPVCKGTLARWCTKVLHDAGVDINVFKSHSTRGASTSMAESKGLSLKDINNAVGWSSRCNTFAKFYRKPIKANFGDAVLTQP